MSKAFTHRTPVEHTPSERTDVVVDPEHPTDLLDVVSSGTAQKILGRLDGDPATASDLADAVDTSLQNVQYHLDRLHDAGLVEAVDTWYSSRGTEMTVYALASERLVVRFGTRERDADPEP